MTMFPGEEFQDDIRRQQDARRAQEARAREEQQTLDDLQPPPPPPPTVGIPPTPPPPAPPAPEPAPEIVPVLGPTPIAPPSPPVAPIVVVAPVVMAIAPPQFGVPAPPPVITPEPTPEQTADVLLEPTPTFAETIISIPSSALPRTEGEEAEQPTQEQFLAESRARRAISEAMTLGLIGSIPILGTVALWNRMNKKHRAASIALDGVDLLVAFIPIKALLRGTTGTRRQVIQAEKAIEAQTIKLLASETDIATANALKATNKARTEYAGALGDLRAIEETIGVATGERQALAGLATAQNTAITRQEALIRAADRLTMRIKASRELQPDLRINKQRIDELTQNILEDTRAAVNLKLDKTKDLARRQKSLDSQLTKIHARAEDVRQGAPGIKGFEVANEAKKLTKIAEKLSTAAQLRINVLRKRLDRATELSDNMTGRGVRRSEEIIALSRDVTKLRNEITILQASNAKQLSRVEIALRDAVTAFPFDRSLWSNDMFAVENQRRRVLKALDDQLQGFGELQIRKGDFGDDWPPTLEPPTPTQPLAPPKETGELGIAAPAAVGGGPRIVSERTLLTPAVATVFTGPETPAGEPAATPEISPTDAPFPGETPGTGPAPEVVGTEPEEPGTGPEVTTPGAIGQPAIEAEPEVLTPDPFEGDEGDVLITPEPVPTSTEIPGPAPDPDPTPSPVESAIVQPEPEPFPEPVPPKDDTPTAREVIRDDPAARELDGRRLRRTLLPSLPNLSEGEAVAEARLSPAVTWKQGGRIWVKVTSPYEVANFSFPHARPSDARVFRSAALAFDFVRSTGLILSAKSLDRWAQFFESQSAESAGVLQGVIELEQKVETDRAELIDDPLATSMTIERERLRLSFERNDDAIDADKGPLREEKVRLKEGINKELDGFFPNRPPRRRIKKASVTFGRAAQKPVTSSVTEVDF